MHEGQLKDPGWLNKRVAEYLEEYKNAQENLATSNAVPSRIIWQTPPPNEYKLNFDAAIFSDLQCSGFGAIIRNTNGEVIAGMSAKGPYVNSSKEAEVLACQKSIEFSMEAGFF